MNAKKARNRGIEAHRIHFFIFLEEALLIFNGISINQYQHLRDSFFLLIDTTIFLGINWII